MKGRILLIANNIYAISLFNVNNNISFSYLDKINNIKLSKFLKIILKNKFNKEVIIKQWMKLFIKVKNKDRLFI